MPSSSNVACSERLLSSAICTASFAVSGFASHVRTASDAAASAGESWLHSTRWLSRSETTCWTSVKAALGDCGDLQADNAKKETSRTRARGLIGPPDVRGLTSGLARRERARTG